MKKVISLLMILMTGLLLTVFLASCSNGTLDAETSEDTSSDTTRETVLETTADTTSKPTDDSSGVTTESETEAETEETYDDGLIRLSKNGTALYRVIRAQHAGTDTKAIAVDLTKQLNNLDSDASFDIKTDTYPLAQYLEILVGNTSHEESDTVSDGLEVDGWAVKKIGGKIVIYGTTVKALTSAVEYFNSCVSVNTDGDVVLDLAPEGYFYKGSAPFFSEDQPISSFSIVTRADFNSYAVELQSAIEKKYGVKLTIKTSDTADKTQNEILIGAYSREETAEALSEVSQRTDGYIVKAEGSKLIIAGHSNTSTMIAVKSLIDIGFDTELSSDPQISNGVLIRSDSAFGDNISAKYLTEGAEVRIMSFNVLSENFCDISAESRRYDASGTILAYMPDVIGFQEFDDGYQAQIMPLLTEDYEFINLTKNDGSVGYNGMAYNKNTLTMLENGYVEYRRTLAGRYHKYISYGVFKTKSTDETFAVMNLHWDVDDDYKMMQSEDTVALIEQLRAEYSNCPVFVTGDYNTNRHSDYFKALLANANAQTAEISAETKINDEYNTYHGIPLGTLPGVRDTSIDHVVHTSNATALTYKVIIDLPTLYASDHNPVIADFALN